MSADFILHKHMSDERVSNLERRVEKLEELIASVASLSTEVKAIRELIEHFQAPGSAPWCQQHSRTMDAFDKRLASVEQKVWYACGIAAAITFIAEKLLTK